MFLENKTQSAPALMHEALGLAYWREQGLRALIVLYETLKYVR